MILQKKSPIEIRKYILEQDKNFSSEYQVLMKNLFNLIYESKLEEEKKKAILLEIGEHLYRDAFVIDHEINFFCCVINLCKIIS
jgi:hypothetical protein